MTTQNRKPFGLVRIIATSAMGSAKPNPILNSAGSHRTPRRRASWNSIHSTGSSTAPPVCLVSEQSATAMPAASQRRRSAYRNAATIAGSMKTSKVAAWVSSGERPMDSSRKSAPAYAPARLPQRPRAIDASSTAVTRWATIARVRSGHSETEPKIAKHASYSQGSSGGLRSTTVS